MEPLQIHGGTRPGAGRPPALASQLAEAKKLARHLQGAVRLGLQQLADVYPELMKKAIDKALKEDNDKMLEKLLDLLPRMVRIDDGEVTPINLIMQKIRLQIASEVTVNVGGGPKVVEGER